MLRAEHTASPCGDALEGADASGKTFEDPDGYTASVLQQAVRRQSA